jgi:NAD-dependent SIR2 family protein deacetylase
MKEGWFVFTSNVDGHFQASGFGGERIVECHGSLFRGQCLHGCGAPIFSAETFRVDVDENTFRAKEPLPRCPVCEGLARPNVLMFGDWGWDGERTEAAEERLEAWLRRIRGKRLVIVEMGAGTRVPSVRLFGERVASVLDARLVRINPREPEVRRGGISLSMGALEALQRIDALLPAQASRSWPPRT